MQSVLGYLFGSSSTPSTTPTSPREISPLSERDFVIVDSESEEVVSWEEEQETPYENEEHLPQKEEPTGPKYLSVAQHPELLLGTEFKRKQRTKARRNTTPPPYRSKFNGR